MWFCTELEKSNPSSVNFAGIFLYFQIVFFTISFSILILIELILFSKKTLLTSDVNKVYFINFCLSFFLQSLKTKTWILLSVVSVFLPLTFTISKSSSIFSGTIVNEKWFDNFSCYQIYLFHFPFRDKKFLSSRWVKNSWFR